jgi:mannosyltransferase OCH1-like enzyme
VVAAVAAARVEAEEQAALRIKQVMRNASVQRRKDHTIGLKQKGLAANSTLSTELATAVARYAKQPQQDIPHKMHQTWRGHNHSTPLPDWVKSSVRNWKNTNPGYSHTMHDDGDIERRVRAKSRRPSQTNAHPYHIALSRAHVTRTPQVRSLHPELIPAFEQMKPIQKADLFRYMVLYDEGGYYADCDVDCMQPIDRWRIHACFDWLL